MKAYYDFMVDLAVILGADRERAQEELRETLELEMKLANVSFSIDYLERNNIKLICIDFIAARGATRPQRPVQSIHIARCAGKVSIHSMG